ncbi:MAG: YceD family protein [Acidimicrobiales bacterium]
MDPFVVHVAKLRRVPGTRWHEVRTAPVDPEGVIMPRSGADSAVPDGGEAICEVTLESFSGGVMVSGTVSAPWRGMCRRCARSVEGSLRVPVRERFTEPAAGYGDQEDDEAYPIHDDLLDLGPMVRDAVVLELPLAPLCADECKGLCPSCGCDRNEEECRCEMPRDPRWANLDVLRSAH